MNEKTKKTRKDSKDTKAKTKGNSQKSNKKSVGETNSVIPDFLKSFITQEVWDQYSQIRRDSFAKLAKNPNAFFYRNRPPGEPQKFGPFSAEEEEQFMERVRYFREDLHINDGLWGLFSVPLIGRLGYQCSNYYRILLSEGKIHDPKYQKLENGKFSYVHGTGRSYPEESYDILEKEAFDYIQKCLAEGNNRPISIAPEYVRRGRGRKRLVDKKVKRCADDRIYTYDDVKDKPTSKLFHIVDIDHADIKKNDKNFLFGLTPVHYSPDMFTGKPMEEPLLDQYAGIVLDRVTWELCFRGHFASSCKKLNILAKSFDDLIILNPESYREFRFLISNVLC